MSKPAAANDKLNGTRTYPYPPTGDLFTSVTTILSATHDKSLYLVPWSARLAAERAVDQLNELAWMLNGEGRQPGARDTAVKYLKDAAKQARELKADAGSYVHDVAEALVLWAASPDTAPEIPLPDLPSHLADAEYDEGRPVREVTDWMIWGFMNWVSDFSPQFQATEMTVFNPALKVAGTLDLIAHLPGLALGPRGRRFIPGDGLTPCIDIKTGKNPEVTWPEQVACYRRSPWALLRTGDMVETPPTDCGCVLHLRPEYPRGYRLMLIAGEDDARAWNRFRRNVSTYYERSVMRAKPGKVVYPLRPDGTIPAPLIADLDGEGYGRGLSAVVRALGPAVDIDQIAAMTSTQLLNLRGVGPATVDTLRGVLADFDLTLAGESGDVTVLGKVAA